MGIRYPRCDKDIEWEENEWRPFCSERCKLIDLGAWLLEEYRIPERPISPSEEKNLKTQKKREKEKE